ncbi:unnamed protein product [Ambrosiozyma monospora]|uniref:Unnamed protein product n=1 Tax=Ambrosiozyma monospora TaxID=43982 RepID=A0ACB5T4K9_AMBMO|nr:unnamed protein product [Ambrosiozyma monospora]
MDWQPDFSQLANLRELNLLEFESLELVSNYLSSIPTTSLEALSISVVDIYVFGKSYDSTGTSEIHSFDLLNLSRFTNVSELSVSHLEETNVVKLNSLPPSLTCLKYIFLYEPSHSYDGISSSNSNSCKEQIQSVSQFQSEGLIICPRKIVILQR